MKTETDLNAGWKLTGYLLLLWEFGQFLVSFRLPHKMFLDIEEEEALYLDFR